MLFSLSSTHYKVQFSPFSLRLYTYPCFLSSSRYSPISTTLFARSLSPVVVLYLPTVSSSCSLASSRCSPISTILFARSLSPVAVLYLLSYSRSPASSRCSSIPIILFALSLLPPLCSPPRCLFFSILNEYY